jgi:hypothetical protein
VASFKLRPLYPTENTTVSKLQPSGILEYCTVKLRKSTQTFQRCVLHPKRRSTPTETVRRNISQGCQHHIRRRENRKLTQLQQPQNRRLGVSQSRLDAVAKTNSTVHVENQTPTTQPIDSHCTELSRLKSARSLPRKFCLPLNTTI